MRSKARLAMRMHGPPKPATIVSGGIQKEEDKIQESELRNRSDRQLGGTMIQIAIRLCAPEF
jgi:hypothetical protein